MRYLIYAAASAGEEELLYEAPVEEGDRQYLSRIVEAALSPLSDEQYMHSVAVLLHTFARSSYILDGDVLYWCVEWNPGLVVVKFSPESRISWCAVRSPIPEFGGRTPLQADIDAYDEEAENHQYNLVFSAWDAQFDEQYRKWGRFVPAGPGVSAAHEKALGHANQLGEKMQERFSETFQQWATCCKDNIAGMAGEGMRVN